MKEREGKMMHIHERVEKKKKRYDGWRNTKLKPVLTKLF